MPRKKPELGGGLARRSKPTRSKPTPCVVILEKVYQPYVEGKSCHQQNPCLPAETGSKKKKPVRGDGTGFFRFLLGNSDGGGIHHEVAV